MSEASGQRPAEMPDSGIYPSQALASNLKQLRKLRRLSQEAVAKRMTALRYGRPGKPGGRKDERVRGWNRSAVGEIEAGTREATVDELVGLCIVFGVSITDLLDLGEDGLALGNGVFDEGAPVIRAARARSFIRGDINIELTDYAVGQMMKLRTLEVEGKKREYFEAIGISVEFEEPPAKKEDEKP